MQAVSAEDEPKADDVGGVSMGPDFEAPAQDLTAAAASTAPPPSLPADITTEVNLAKALGMTRAAFRKWAGEQRLTAYPMPKGTRGGNRYSGGEALEKFKASAKARMDAMCMADTTSVLDATLEDPQFALPK